MNNVVSRRDGKWQSAAGGRRPHVTQRRATPYVGSCEGKPARVAGEVKGNGDHPRGTETMNNDNNE